MSNFEAREDVNEWVDDDVQPTREDVLKGKVVFTGSWLSLLDSLALVSLICLGSSRGF